MNISRKQLEAYDKALSDEQERALKLFDELYKQGKALDPNLDVAGLRELAISSIHESLEVFGGAASEHALKFFEDTAGTDTADIDYYELDDETKHRIERYVHGKAQHLVDSDEESFVELCKQLLETEVHESANRTMRKAADKLGLRYARVPMGGETCEFCLMLASRGYVYHNEKSAGADDPNHYHSHCRCKVIVEGAKIEGYNPSALYKQWKNNATGYFRKSESTDRSVKRPAPEAMYNNIVKMIENIGGSVVAGEDAEKYLNNIGNVDAAAIGDVMFLRQGATKSELLEESYHVMQHIKGEYNNMPFNELRLRREIDAQKYLLEQTKRHIYLEVKLNSQKRI